MYYGINFSLGAGQVVTKADLQRIRDLGFNTVRLPVAWNQLQPNNADTVSETVFTEHMMPNNPALNMVVNWCQEIGLYLILLVYWSPTWQCPAWTGLGGAPTAINGIVKAGNPRNGMINCCKILARHYVGSQNVFFEITNEGSTATVAETAANYKSFLEEAFDVVKGEGVTTPIIAQPLNTASSWEEIAGNTQADPSGTRFQPTVNRNIVWAVHRYTPYNEAYDPEKNVWGYSYATNQEAWVTYRQYLLWRNKRIADWCHSNGQSIINTEFGKAPSEGNYELWLDDILAHMEMCGFGGWVFHSWDKFGEGYSLIDADGVIKQPLLNALKAHMIGEATPPPIISPQVEPPVEPPVTPPVEPPVTPPTPTDWKPLIAITILGVGTIVLLWAAGQHDVSLSTFIEKKT